MAWFHPERCRWRGRGWCWRPPPGGIATPGGRHSPPGSWSPRSREDVGDLWTIAELWPIGLHLGVASLLVLGALFDDGVGRLARRSGALALLVLGLDASTGHPFIWRSMPPGLIAWYPLLIAASAWSFSFLVHDRLYLGSGAISLAGWLVHSGGGTYSQLRKVVVGLDQIVWGMIFFLIAMAISLRKAGIWPRSMPKRLAWLVGHWWRAGWESAPPSGIGPARNGRGVEDLRKCQRFDLAPKWPKPISQGQRHGDRTTIRINRALKGHNTLKLGAFCLNRLRRTSARFPRIDRQV